MVVQIKLKWNKEEYDVDIEESETVEVFKTQIWTLTNVPADRQKFLGFPGGMLKDTDDLAAKCAKLKAGAKIQLIGTAEEAQLKAPEAKTVFEEDLSPEEKAKILREKKVEVLPHGIKNLGNTCYMNSTLQCLFSCKDLTEAVGNFGAADPADRNIDSLLTTQYKQLTQVMGTACEPIVPVQFVMALRQRFPTFAQMQNGNYMQQDAEECVNGLLTVFANTMKTEGDSNKVDELFGFTLKSKMKNLECDEEPVTMSEEKQRIIMCHLGTQTDPVSHIHQGLQLSMKNHVEKESSFLGRSAQYEKASALDSLPPYMIVQFARFGYKGANEWAGTTAAKVKLVRKCAFAGTLDAYDLCTDELKKVLSVGRLKKKEVEDRQVEAERNRMPGEAKGGASSSSATGGDVEMKDRADTADGDVEMKPIGKEYETGQYDLVAIVSHKGRNADGGHYVGWTRWKKKSKENKEERWLQFDDETVTAHDWKDIMGLGCDLQGGKADTQIAYLCFYKKVNVFDDGEVLGSGDAAPAASADAAAAPSA